MHLIPNPEQQHVLMERPGQVFVPRGQDGIYVSTDAGIAFVPGDFSNVDNDTIMRAAANIRIESPFTPVNS